mmetsp:Transcript_96697/g.189919  ORF Transcript_96697/g.189919 Transcript_96697/m.189919 type:complete len:459 (+) Transcript_96697:69-1445(+)
MKACDADLEGAAWSGASTKAASFEVQVQEARAPPLKSGPRRGRCRGCAARASVAAVAVSMLLYIGAVAIMSQAAISSMVTIDDREVMRYCAANSTDSLASSISWPVCGVAEWTASCARPCYSEDLLRRVQALNKKHPGRLVAYRSRPHAGSEVVDLSGWYMPAPPETRPRGRPPPRVVVQHGFTENSNYFRYVLFAYMLRSVGVDVIVNNFRDHCYSANSSRHIYEWGHAYPYDLLGAWDYARTDPDGIMGGPLEANQVGLSGFSKGGFTTLNAFGLEGEVPAAWVDGAPSTPGEVFAHSAKQRFIDAGVPVAVSSIFVEPAWRAVLAYAHAHGVDLNENIPAIALPMGPDLRRPVHVIQNTQDHLVPMSEHTQVMKVFAEYPEKYDVQGDWVVTGKCHGNGHCTEHLRLFDEYFARLCRFWRGAFAVDAGRCDDLKRKEAAGERPHNDVVAIETLAV